ncbi:DUF6126 family protein [Streptomyces sp. ISL-66]|uniref:DUF6126 family protein n=1 Tax=Streptomyces sp. ISL-66 TaxID=2819186 RepID=UPI0027E46A9B|nr:DUF6126 family protein [Streptomyces sp. ISL-66]
MSQTEQQPQAPQAPAAQTQPSGATEVQPAEAAASEGVRRRLESKFPRGLVIRLIAYLFVGHLFAFFVYLLFVLGGKNQ